MKIFCVESWSGDLRNKSTVLPLLELLESEADIQFIHQRVDTVDELGHYLDRWEALSTFEVGFLAFHGDAGQVHVGGRGSVTLTALVDRATQPDDDWDYSLNLVGKTVYLGSCLTMGDTKEINEFRRLTSARMVCGYTKSVNWIEAASFEMLLLNRLAQNADPKRALKPLLRDHREFAKRLGFRAIPGPPS